MGVLCITAATSYHIENYDRSLKSLCRDVDVFHYGADMTDTFWTEGGAGRRAAANVELRDLANRMKADGRLGVVFISAYDDLLESRTLRLFQKLGAVTVNYMVDMPTQWYRLWRTASLYDSIAIAHRDFEQDLRRRANDTLFLPMAASPEVYQPAARDISDGGPALSFVGSWTPTREAVLSRLITRFPALEVYGNWNPPRSSWPNLRRYAHDAFFYGIPRMRAERRTLPARLIMRRVSIRNDSGSVHVGPHARVVPFTRMVDLFSKSKINIGITQSEGNLGAWWAPRWVRGRDFEVPICGGFYLVQRAPEHDLHYALGEEIETWSTFDELVAKIAYFAERPELASAIAARGYARALRDHTWQRRFRTLFAHLGHTAELKSPSDDGCTAANNVAAVGGGG